MNNGEFKVQVPLRGLQASEAIKGGRSMNVFDRIIDSFRSVELVQRIAFQHKRRREEEYSAYKEYLLHRRANGSAR